MSYFKYKNKKVFYKEIGEGTPLLMLHGNTASSNMFLGIMQNYLPNYKVILIDFLGCGQSDRVEELDEDLWYDQAMQVVCFLKEKRYKNVNIIGTSGGALTAINVGLEHPELVDKIIADSFEGEKADPLLTEALAQGRELSKQNIGARKFYEMMNGPDWERVVDADTKAVVSHGKNIVNFFHKPISELKTKILFTGSNEDDLLQGISLEKLYDEFMKKVKYGQKHIFEHGNHPAMMSNEEEFVKLSKSFLGQ